MSRASAWVLQHLLGEALLFTAVVVQWMQTYPLSNDGACHIYNAWLTHALVSGNYSEATRYIYLAEDVGTNWFTTALLYPLAGILSPGVCARLIVTLILVSSFYSYRYFIRSLTTGPLSAAGPIAFYFAITSWSLWMGFWNFCLGLAAAVFAIGYVARRLDERWRLSDTALLLGASVLALVCHPVAAAVLAGTLLPLVYQACMGGWKPQIAKVSVLKKRAPVLAISVALLGGVLAARQHGGGGHIFDATPSRLFKAALQYPIDGFQFFRVPYLDQEYGVLLLCLLIGSGVYATVKRRLSWPALLVCGLVLAGAHLIVSDAQGGGYYLAPRLSYASVLLLAVWALAVNEIRTAKLLGILLAFLSAVTLAGQFAVLHSADRYVRETVAAARNAGIRPGQTILRVRYPAPATERTYMLSTLRGQWFITQAFDWVAAETHSVHVGSYELLTTIFPNRLRSQFSDVRQPLSSLEGPGEGDGHAAALRFVLQRIPVDWVTVIGEEGVDWHPSPERASVFEVLASAGYELPEGQSSTKFIRFFRRRSGQAKH